jgi:hypothetical protein
MSEPESVNQRGDSRPIPDPTALTTSQLLREIAALRDVVGARMDGVVKDVGRLEQEIRERPAAIENHVGHLRELNEEKFRSIQTQFTERDVRTEMQARDSKVAVDAALQAAKEAVAEQNRSSALSIAKSETATMKAMDQQGVLIATSTQALDAKIVDVKERLTRIEGKGEGVVVTQTGQQTSISIWVAVIGLILGTVIGAAGLVFALVRH